MRHSHTHSNQPVNQSGSKKAGFGTSVAAQPPSYILIFSLWNASHRKTTVSVEFCVIVSSLALSLLSRCVNCFLVHHLLVHTLLSVPDASVVYCGNVIRFCDSTGNYNLPVLINITWLMYIQENISAAAVSTCISYLFTLLHPYWHPNCPCTHIYSPANYAINGSSIFFN